jgi:hypothetical protein
MLRRKPLRRKEWERIPREDRIPMALSTLQPVARGTYAGGVSGARPKGETAKPGKRTPTKAEREWMARIVAHGCAACKADGSGYVFPEVHHILSGGVRMGHLHTIPLCSGHHRDGAGIPGLIARHPWRKRFEAKYGTEASLLQALRSELMKGTP